MQSCAHQLAVRHRSMENLVGLVIAAKGGPCTGKSTLARALAKSLRCTIASQDDFLSCTSESDTEQLLSADTPPADHFNDLSYEVLWRVAETQLRRHHSVIVDSCLHTRAHLDRFLSLASSNKDIHVMPIIIECWAKDKSEWRRRLSKTYGPGDTERILEGDEDDGSCDTGGDIPKLIIDTTSQVGIEEHVRNVESFIMACLDKKLYGEIPISQLAQGCSVCKTAYVEKVTAHLPTTLKHQCHEHELALNNCAGVYASGLRLNFHCFGCGGRGMYLHYCCTDDSCTFLLHAKCALNLPLSIAAPFHQWHPPLVLASRPLDPELCYCDFCEEKRHPQDWIYLCKECEYHVHIECANPEFYQSPDLIELKSSDSDGPRIRIWGKPLYPN